MVFLHYPKEMLRGKRDTTCSVSFSSTFCVILWTVCRAFSNGRVDPLVQPMIISNILEICSLMALNRWPALLPSKRSLILDKSHSITLLMVFFIPCWPCGSWQHWPRSPLNGLLVEGAGIVTTFFFSPSVSLLDCLSRASWPPATCHVMSLSHATRGPGQCWVMLHVVWDSAESCYTLSGTVLSHAIHSVWDKLGAVRDSAESS